LGALAASIYQGRRVKMEAVASTVAGNTSMKTVIIRIEMVAYILRDLIFCILFGNFVY